MHRSLAASARPEAFPIVLADGLQFCIIRLRRGLQIVAHLQLPSSVGENIIYRNSRMDSSHIGLAVIAKAQHALGGNHGRRATAWKSDAFAPACAFAVAGAGNVADPLRQAMFAMLQQSDKAVRQRSNVAGATRSRQPDRAVLSLHLGGVQVAV